MILGGNLLKIHSLALALRVRSFNWMNCRAGGVIFLCF